MTFIQDSVSLQVNEASNSTHDTGNDISTTEKRDDLTAISDPATQLLIWQRSIPLNLHAWMEKLNPAQLPNLRVLIEPASLRHALEEHFDECGMAAGDMRNLLITDIEELVVIYASITESDRVDVRLERVNHNACWKFHRDFVDKRLITTYRGLTTEWVQPQHSSQAMRQQKSFEGPIESLGLYDVAIFKGRNDRSGSGIVHRSPPIEGTGCTRLLLCLNQKSAVSPDPWFERP